MFSAVSYCAILDGMSGIGTSIIQQYLINQVNVSAITIYPRPFGTCLIGTRPTETRLIGTLKIDRVQLERVSLACNLVNKLGVTNN